MISRIDIEDMTDAQDKAPSLLPCPFCGSAASAEGAVRYSRPVADCTWSDGDPVTEAFFCNCPSCGADNQGPLHGYRTKDKAIAAWNRRADLARPSQAGGERVARLEDALRKIAAMATPSANATVRRMEAAALAAMDTPKGGGDE